MGPTNVALVKLFHADTKYRQAQSRYEAASRDVKITQAYSRLDRGPISRCRRAVERGFTSNRSYREGEHRMFYRMSLCAAVAAGLAATASAAVVYDFEDGVNPFTVTTGGPNGGFGTGTGSVVSDRSFAGTQSMYFGPGNSAYLAIDQPTRRAGGMAPRK